MKTILLTGATDGIGLETAKDLAKQGHHLILHGRSDEKLESLKRIILDINKNLKIDLIKADLSIISDVHQMVEDVKALNTKIDIIINNAGVFITDNPITVDQIDIRFAVNTISPYILTMKLIPLLNQDARIVNVSSAAQTDINLNSFELRNNASQAYAESKLAIIMWSMELTNETGLNVISVNPKSYLGSKMVKEAYGKEGYDLKLGSDILIRAALSDEFKDAHGKYYDNDYCKFASPHSFALVKSNRETLIQALKKYI